MKTTKKKLKPALIIRPGIPLGETPLARHVKETHRLLTKKEKVAYEMPGENRAHEV
jgi:hypothetical protein